MKNRYVLFLVICFHFFLKMVAQDLSEKANALLDTHSEELRAEALFSLDGVERYNMNNVPLPEKDLLFTILIANKNRPHMN